MFSGTFLTALLLLVLVHYSRQWFPSVQYIRVVFIFIFTAFMGSGYDSRKADLHVRSRCDNSISTWAFWMTGKWCWFHVKFLLSSVCFTLEIAKTLSADAMIQSLFLSMTDWVWQLQQKISESFRTWCFQQETSYKELAEGWLSGQIQNC